MRIGGVHAAARNDAKSGFKVVLHVVVTLRVMISMHSWATSTIKRRVFGRADFGTIDRS
jgi:hypothetical protein